MWQNTTFPSPHPQQLTVIISIKGCLKITAMEEIIFQIYQTIILWGHVAIKEPFRLLLSVLLHISLRCISAFHTVCLLCYSLFNSDPLLPAIQSFTFPSLKVITTLICCPLLCMPECICGWLESLLCVCVEWSVCRYFIYAHKEWCEYIYVTVIRTERMSQ